MTATTDPAADAARREAFDRDRVCYEQNFQQFRAMNQIMWQVPLLAITITGGLWYAAVSVTGAQEFKRPLFALSAILDIALNRKSVVDPFDRKICVAQGGFGSKTCRGLDRSDAMAAPSECRRVPSRPRPDV